MSTASARRAVPAGPAGISGVRNSRGRLARGAHSFRNAICTPVVESTRSAASTSAGSRTGSSPVLVRAPHTSRIAARTGTSRRFEPRYLITARRLESGELREGDEAVAVGFPCVEDGGQRLQLGFPSSHEAGAVAIGAAEGCRADAVV